MKKIVSICSFGALALTTFASHNLGGHISYTCLSNITNTYEITVTTYTDNNTQSDRCSLIVYFGDGDSASVSRTNGPITNNCSPAGDGVLAFNFGGTTVRKNIYRCTHAYPGQGIYMIRMTDPNRTGGILNLTNSLNSPFVLEARLMINPLLGQNSSAALMNDVDVDSAAVNQPHSYNSSATDPDGDSLAFTFIVPIGSTGYVNPPTSNIFWINNFMGLVTWDNPTAIGEYVYAIRIDEYRLVNNQYYLIGYTTREVFTMVAATVSAGDLDTEGVLLNVFPNPSNGNLAISLKTGMVLEGMLVELFDITGKKVEVSYTIEQQNIVINHSGLSPGLYIFKLKNENGYLTSGKFEIADQ